MPYAVSNQQPTIYFLGAPSHTSQVLALNILGRETINRPHTYKKNIAMRACALICYKVTR